MKSAGMAQAYGAAHSRPVAMLPTVVVPHAIRKEIESVLKACGSHRWECVVYLAAPLQAPGTPAGALREVVGFFHPEHGNAPHYYAVPQSAVSAMSTELYEKGWQIVAQIHTHPGHAFHSGRDDGGPMVHAPGFVSVVVPWFCRDGLAELPGCYVTVYEGGGSWRELAQGEASAVFQVR